MQYFLLIDDSVCNLYPLSADIQSKLVGIQACAMNALTLRSVCDLVSFFPMSLPCNKVKATKSKRFLRAYTLLKGNLSFETIFTLYKVFELC